MFHSGCIFHRVIQLFGVHHEKSQAHHDLALPGTRVAGAEAALDPTSVDISMWLAD